MASGGYAKGIEQAWAGSLDFDADTIKVMYAKTGFTLDKDGHNFLSDVQTHRYVGTTDQTLGSKTNTIDTVNNRVELGGGSVVQAVTKNASDLIIFFVGYKDTGVATTSPLIWADDTANVDPNGNNVTYTPNAEGVLQFDYGA